MDVAPARGVEAAAIAVSDRPAAAAAAAPGGATVADAEVAVARMHEMSSDLRGCAVIAPGGEALAASGELDRWGPAATDLLAAADVAAGETASQVHVGTEDGEAFAVRLGEFAVVAVAERFTLASLILFDMRTVLRDLVRAAGGSA